MARSLLLGIYSFDAGATTNGQQQMHNLKLNSLSRYIYSILIFPRIFFNPDLFFVIG